MGLVGSISDSWTPEQRQQFIEDWMDDEPLIQEGFGKKMTRCVVMTLEQVQK